MSIKISSRDLSQKQHKITSHFSYFEDVNGLWCYLSHDGKTEMIGVIPWRSIRTSLKRYDAARAQKAAK